MVQTAVNSAVEALNLLVKCAKNYHMLPQSGCGRDNGCGLLKWVWFSFVPKKIFMKLATMDSSQSLRSLGTKALLLLSVENGNAGGSFELVVSWENWLLFLERRECIWQRVLFVMYWQRMLSVSLLAGWRMKEWKM